MLCKLEYPLYEGGWWVGHKGLEVSDPETYFAKLTKRGQVCRMTILDTDEVLDNTVDLN